MSNLNGKVKVVETRVIVDHTTGEITHEDKLIQRRVSAEKFIMVYLNDMGNIFQLTSDAQYKVLIALWKRTEFGTNKVIVVKSVKNDIVKETGVKFRTIANALTSLTKKGLLIRKDRSVYYLNPKYFFKGSDIQRRQQIRVLIEYNIEDQEEDQLIESTQEI